MAPRDAAQLVVQHGQQAIGRRALAGLRRAHDARHVEVVERPPRRRKRRLGGVVRPRVTRVTHVTRGRDLYAATDLHRLLQVLLDLPEPLYSHHRLITDASGRKLAKSARDTSLKSLRRQGLTAGDIRRLVGLA